MDKSGDDPEFLTTQLPRRHSDILEELLNQLTEGGGQEDTDLGGRACSRILKDKQTGKAIVNGESVGGHGADLRIVADLGDDDSCQKSIIGTTQPSVGATVLCVDIGNKASLPTQAIFVSPITVNLIIVFFCFFLWTYLSL